VTTAVRRPEMVGAIGIVVAAAQPIPEVLAQLGTIADEGLSDDEVVRRQSTYGPNAVASHRAQPWTVLWHQLKSPLLGLLLVAAIASSFVGEQNDAVIIAVIVAASVGLGFVNEFRAEKAAEALHSQIHHGPLSSGTGVPSKSMSLRWCRVTSCGYALAVSCRRTSG
jgi:Mg2+-importing ATPase